MITACGYDSTAPGSSHSLLAPTLCAGEVWGHGTRLQHTCDNTKSLDDKMLTPGSNTLAHVLYTTQAIYVRTQTALNIPFLRLKLARHFLLSRSPADFSPTWVTGCTYVASRVDGLATQIIMSLHQAVLTS